MAKNTGDNTRKGAVKNRVQSCDAGTGLYVKSNATTGEVLGTKTTGGKYKGVAQSVDRRRK